jgi:O-antigen ligase
MTRMLRELLLFGSLAFGVAALGANPDWARYLFCMGLYVFCAVSVLAADPSTASAPHRWSNWPLAILGVIPLLQIVPLPAVFQRILSPAQAAMMASLAQTGILDASPAHRALSIYPAGTLEQFVLLLAVGLSFLAGRHLFRDPGSRQRLAWFMLAVGLIEAMIGLLQYLGKLTLPFLPSSPNPAAVASGTYVNRNHFAGLLEMCFPMAAGLAYGHYLQHIHPAVHRTRRRFRALLTHPDLALFLLLLFLAVWICLGIVFSISRTGITCLLATILFLTLLLGIRHSRRRIQVVTLAFLLALTGYAGYVGMEEILHRFEQLFQEEALLREGRLLVWQDTVTLIRDFPWTGVGLGNYEHAFHRYNRVSRNVIYDHAHNDFLEYLSEWGIPGGLLLIGTVLVVFGRGLRTFFRTEDPRLQALLLGVTGGIFSLLLHSFTDFNLQIPVNLALFALLLAAASAASDTDAQARVDSSGEDGPLPDRS